jgi:chitin synthase
LDEIDNYNRKGMQSYVANNRDFPSSIEKNISLLYQNLWHPLMTNPEWKSKPEEKEARDRSKNRYLKLFSCFKHLNGTKLSSHLWFFEGFCRYLDPEFIVLLDVGTKP